MINEANNTPSPQKHVMGSDRISKIRVSLKNLEAKSTEASARIISDAEQLIYDLSSPKEGNAAELGLALKPFAEAARKMDQEAIEMGFSPGFDEFVTEFRFSLGQMRAARDAFFGTQSEGGK